ncbi:MAG: hypothetical protein Q7K34_02205 [archaeon]|nr:hypothetical protein [archaeon]
MPDFEIFETEIFSKIFDGLDKREHEWISKIKHQLRQNPFGGKPLRFKWFREKKFENKRLYFLVSEKTQRVLLIAFAGKKDQQHVIEQILLDKEKYFQFVENV